jgi:hypothetical protein
MAKRKKPTDDETNENLNKSNESSDDTFGLPDIDYKPLDRVEETTTVVETTTIYSSTEPEEQQTVNEEYHEQVVIDEQPPVSDYPFEEESSPVWPKVLAVLIIVLLAVGGVWYFLVYKPNKDKQELAKREAEHKKHVADSTAAAQATLAEQARLAKDRLKADSIANASKTGVFETLSERTGRYYVVVASAVDDDLLVDHAKKLGKKGVSTKLIPPFRKYKFFRLTIADADTFAGAQQLADSKKAEYTDALWVLKY